MPLMSTSSAFLDLQKKYSSCQLMAFPKAAIPNLTAEFWESNMWNHVASYTEQVWCILTVVQVRFCPHLSKAIGSPAARFAS